MITEVLMSFDESPINIVSVVSTCVRDTFPKAGYIAGNFPIFGLVTPLKENLVIFMFKYWSWVDIMVLIIWLIQAYTFEARRHSF